MERNIDKIIREAEARGDFDNLPGKGKPLPLDYDPTPAELKLGYSMLKNAGYVPTEVQWLKDIDALNEELAGCTNEARREEIIREIREKRLKVAVFLESLRGK
jgi:Domain of unknown function (DUF1992)